MHSNPGAYAALIGSGVSVSAGIPTGWQVVLDLISKVARVLGEDPGPFTANAICPLSSRQPVTATANDKRGHA